MKKVLFSFIAVFALFLFSCEKQSLISDQEKTLATDDDAIETVVDEAAYEVDLFSESNAAIDYVAGTTKTELKGGFFGNRYMEGQAPTVTVERTDGGFPITITIDYGDGVELTNTRVLSGKIIIVVSDRPRTLNATRTITFENFYIDDINIAGTRTITFSASEENMPQASVESLLTITFPDGTVFTREAENLRTFVEGYDTPFIHADNVFHITGFVNITGDDDFIRTKIIIEPLVRKADCRFLVAGVVKITRNDGVEILLDYGDGECDDIATLTKNDETVQITLGNRVHRN